jgi:FkbM family methyltransferase
MYLIKFNERFEKLENNHFFMYNDSENWSKGQFYSNIHEYNLIQSVKEKFITKEKNFVDIGSNIGAWSWLIADKANHVYSFEPNKDVYNCLCANICLKNLSKKIDTFNFGLSNENKEETFYNRKGETESGGSGFIYLGEKDKTEEVEKTILPLRRLDDLNLQNIGFIKIDVEGNEINVLKGAEETLKKNDYPHFLFESWDYNIRKENKFNNEEELIIIKKLREELFSYIVSLNYKILMIEGMHIPEYFLAIHDSHINK